MTAQLTNQIGRAIQAVAPYPQDPTTAYVVTAGGPEAAPWLFDEQNYTSSLYRLRNISLAGNATVESVKRWSPPTPTQATRHRPSRCSTAPSRWRISGRETKARGRPEVLLDEQDPVVLKTGRPAPWCEPTRRPSAGGP
jgi:hypothetical protein